MSISSKLEYALSNGIGIHNTNSINNNNPTTINLVQFQDIVKKCLNIKIKQESLNNSAVTVIEKHKRSNVEVRTNKHETEERDMSTDNAASTDESNESYSNSIPIRDNSYEIDLELGSSTTSRSNIGIISLLALCSAFSL